MHAQIGFFFKDDFLKTVEAKVIILSWCVKHNEAMTINKFQRVRLTFEVKDDLWPFIHYVAYIEVPSIY